MKSKLVWRIQEDDRGMFDEISVAYKTKGTHHNDGIMLHAEMMNDRECFIDVAGKCFWVSVGPDGVTRITNEEDRRSKRQLEPKAL